MTGFTRRAALAGAGVVAAGTLAAVLATRKPGGQVIATPASAETVPLRPLTDVIQPATPGPPAAARFLDAEGGTHTLAEFAGKGLVVNLWATWCVPCVAELPALQAMARAVADADIAVLALSSDRGGAEVVRRFYASHAIGLPIWLDPKGEAARAWGARGLPTTLIIDRTGAERGRLEGAIAWDSAPSLAALRRLVG